MKGLKVLTAICTTGALISSSLGDQHAFIWDSVSGMQDLGSLGGGNSFALGINDSGEVVGFSYLSDNNNFHTFTWTAAGGMVDLGSLPGGESNRGNAINSSGAIVGNGIKADRHQVPFYWTPSGGFVTLEETDGQVYNDAVGINDDGYITGGRTNGTFFRYLGALSGGTNSSGYGINSKRHITGWSEFSADSTTHAIVWTKSKGMRDIGGVGRNEFTDGYWINDHDEVVGFAGPQYIPFYWSKPTGIVLLQDLGGVGGGAFQITNDGTIVGYAAKGTQSNFHAAIWAHYDSAPQDLGTLPGGKNSYGRGINLVGQVVGYADVPKQVSSGTRPSLGSQRTAKLGRRTSFAVSRR
jgi:probable HAF family extracellular repeat protein